MLSPLIYVDQCDPILEQAITKATGVSIIKRVNISTWTINYAIATVTEPRIMLAVINHINDIAMMEISLLHFMCKPILITHPAIQEYDAVLKTIDYINYDSNMTKKESTFIKWFTQWRQGNEN